MKESLLKRISIVVSILIAQSFSGIYSQTFLNGSFETTTASMACNYNLGNGAFNALMANTNAFGTGNETDILINGCFTAGIPNGVRAIGLAATYDEVALALSAPLVAGNSYVLSFWSYGEISFRPLGGLEIGVSMNNNTFGTVIGNVASVANTWINHTICFVAPISGSFITVRNTQNGTIHWNHIDHFEFLSSNANFDFDDFCAGSPNGPTNVITPGGTFSFNPVPTDGATINPVTGQISNAVNGATYTVQYVLGGSCASSSTQTVTVSGISYSSTIVDENCGASDGEISLTPIGGNAPFTYSIDNGLTSQPGGIFSNLSAGTYNVIITDDNGCTATGTENVTNIPGLIIDNFITTNPSCPGACDGQIVVNVSGGTLPYTFQWFDGGGNPIGTNSATITGLCAGTYNVEVSDASGSTTQLFYDDFESGAAGWTLNVPVGAEGADANFFEVDDDEGGVAVGGCGIAGNGDQTLHITSVFFPGGGAAYDAGGLCGFLFCPQTNRQAESPLINTVGQTGLTLNFDFIANGNIPSDQATVWYNAGFGWVQLGGALFSGTGVCAPQGIWTAYSSALPPACENIPNLRIAIRWQNNDDGLGSDPSVAINNIEIVTNGSSSCVATSSASLTDPPNADASFTLTDFCPGTANAASGIATPGGTFVFNPVPTDGATINASTGQISNGVEGTTYTVQYTTPGACPQSSTETVTVNGIDYSAVVTDENCGNADGEIVLTAIGGIPSFNYSIDNGASFQGSATFSNLVNGVYNVIITDGNGCSVSGTENVGNIGGPSIDAVLVTDPSCAGQCDGEITLTVSGGTPPYSYAWEDDAGNPIGTNSPSLIGICAGDYSVTVTDAGGGSAVLNTNSDFETGTGAGCACPTGYTCGNDAGQVFVGVHPVYAVGNQGCVTGPTNYSNSLGANSGTGAIYFYAGADNISTGPFPFVGGEQIELCVWYAGPQGAGPPGQNTAASHFSFGVDGAQVGPDVPVPTNTGWTQFCFTVTMTAGNHTFQILSGGAAQYSLWFDDFTITNTAGGGGSSCPVTQNFTLIDPVAADPTFTLTDFCAGDPNQASGVVTPGGTFTFNPDLLDGSSINTITGEISNGVPGTTYSIQYTTAGACPQSQTNTVTVNGITYNAVITDEACASANGEIDLSVNGGGPSFEYSIDNGATFQGAGLFTSLVGGTYSIVINDLSSGCSATGTELVGTTGNPIIDQIDVVDESCVGQNDGSIEIVAISNGSGTYSYSWDIVPDPATALVTGLTGGVYTVTVTDDVTGCQVVETITVNSGVVCCDLAIDNVSGLDLSCFGSNDGTINITIIGGVGIVTYSVDNGTYSENNSTGIFSNLPAGLYDVTVTDANGCTDSEQFQVNEPDRVEFTSVVNDLSCFNANDGSIEFNAFGGLGTYSYSIDNGLTWSPNAVFTGLSVGSYDLLVQDASGCVSALDVVLIAEPDEIQTTVTITNESCFGSCDGELLFVSSGGTGVLSVSVNGVITSNPVKDLCGGAYAYTITDEQGCQISGTADVIPAVQIVVDELIITDDDCNQSCVGQIQIASDEAVTYSIGWVSNAIGLFPGLCSDNYAITLTDANGCTLTTNALVNSGTTAVANFALLPSLVTTLDAEFQVINNSYNADAYEWIITGPESYEYTSSEEDFSLELPPVAGAYTVCLIAINNGGCPDTLCQGVVVKDEFLLFVPNAFTPNADEFNNYLPVYATGIDEYQFNMQIFNRWGEVVWETNDISIAWDGTYNGQVCQDGTYTWKIVVKDPYTDERKTFVGHINLLK